MMARRPVPADLFAPGRRHLFVFAHQDDDLAYAGILHRAAALGHVLYVTNGDGLAPAAGMEPQAYAQVRRKEAEQALGLLGYAPGQLSFLGHSELFFYPLFVELARHADASRIPEAVREQAGSVMAAIIGALAPLVAQADVVWTLAWQGGHPEHDLTHFAAARAVAAARMSQGRSIPFFELPAYELTVLVPLRFPPWKRGEAFRVRLTDVELRLKERAFAAYASQLHLTNQFRRLITLYGALSALRLKPFSFTDYAREEEFAAVPEVRDYTRSPHLVEKLDYIFEDYQGTPISFYGSISRIVQLVEGETGG